MTALAEVLLKKNSKLRTTVAFWRDKCDRLEEQLAQNEKDTMALRTLYAEQISPVHGYGDQHNVIVDNAMVSVSTHGSSSSPYGSFPSAAVFYRSRTEQKFWNEITKDSALVRESAPPVSFKPNVKTHISESDVKRLVHQIKELQETNKTLTRRNTQLEQTVSSLRSRDNDKAWEQRFAVQHRQLVGCVRRIKWLLEKIKDLEHSIESQKTYVVRLENKVLVQSRQCDRYSSRINKYKADLAAYARHCNMHKPPEFTSKQGACSYWSNNELTTPGVGGGGGDEGDDDDVFTPNTPTLANLLRSESNAEDQGMIRSGSEADTDVPEARGRSVAKWESEHKHNDGDDGDENQNEFTMEEIERTSLFNLLSFTEYAQRADDDEQPE